MISEMREPTFTQYVREEGGSPRIVTCADIDRNEHSNLTFVWTIPIRYEAMANGLPIEGLGQAYKLEEQLTKALERLGGFYLGHITFGGAMTVVFRGPSKAPAQVEVRTGLFKKERISVTTREDASWQWHDQEMAPTHTELHMSKNRQLMDILSEKGDRHEVIRPVDFTAIFPSEADREAFLASVTGEGYGLNREGNWISDSGQYWCGIAKETSIEPEVIADCCAFLDIQARSNKGEFDGWATHVTK